MDSSEHPQFAGISIWLQKRALTSFLGGTNDKIIGGCGVSYCKISVEGESKEFSDAAKNHFAVEVGGVSQKNSQTLRKTRLTVGGKMQ